VGGVQATVTRQSPLPPTSTAWSQLAQRQVFGFQIVVVHPIVLAVISCSLLKQTRADPYLYAVGANAEAARLSGVPTGKWIRFSFPCSGMITGVTGVLYCSLNGSVAHFGAGPLLPASTCGIPRVHPARARSLQPPERSRCRASCPAAASRASNRSRAATESDSTDSDGAGRSAAPSPRSGGDPVPGAKRSTQVAHKPLDAVVLDNPT
jgi:Branched-chain amino acid transport system / permease component